MDVRPRSSSKLSALSLLARAPSLRRDYLSVLRELQARHGDAFRIEFPRRIHYLFHPEDVRHVLRDQASRYRKSDNYRQMEPLLGKGMLTTDGEEWREKRRVVAPEFHASQLARFEPLILRRVEAMLDGWEGRETIDIGRELNALAFGIAGEAFFGAELEERAGEMARALETAADGALRRILSPLKLPLTIPTPGNRRIVGAIGVIDSIVASLIEARRETGTSRAATDVLGRILDHESGRSGNARDSRDQSVTLLLAGHETTSLAMTWLMYLLARNPGTLAQVEEEARGSRAESELLARVIDESLRLYPSVPVVSRNAAERDEFPWGLEIGAGEMVQLSAWVTHRHPRFWDSPDVFDPGRFEPARKAAIEPGAYIPFGMGPRVCIGAGLALAQMRLVARCVLRRFHVAPAESGEVAIRPSITLRPSRPILLRIRPVRNH